MLKAIITTLLLFSSVTASASQLLIEAKRLLQNGESEKAYSLLLPKIDSHAGNPDFDYLLGVAALDSGKPGEAIFALQRVLAVNPNFAGARMELARAYFNLGEYRQATIEFNLLLNQNPPENAQQVIRQYLDAIDQQRQQNHTGLHYYWQANAGYDNNINRGSEIDTFYIQGIPLTVSEKSRQTPSSFLGVNTGGTYTHPITHNRSLFARANLQIQSNPDAHFADMQSMDIQLGIKEKWRPLSLNVFVQSYQTQTDGRFNNRGNFLTAELTRQDQQRHLALFSRIGMIDYQPDLDLQDIEQFFIGASLSQVAPQLYNTSFNFSLLYGSDKTKDPLSPYGREMVGFKVSAATKLSANKNLFITANLMDSAFEGEFPDATKQLPVSDKRGDLLTEIRIGSSWQINRHQLLRPQLIYSINQSNLNAFDHDRIALMITFKQDYYR